MSRPLIVLGLVLLCSAYANNQAAGGEEAQPAAVVQQLPKLLDLGSTRCIPCKKMAPILDELKKEYAGRVDVEFIDVWVDRTMGEKYGVKAIPTQIFFDADGKEVFRHTGFYGKEEIIAQFTKMGVK